MRLHRFSSISIHASIWMLPSVAMQSRRSSDRRGHISQDFISGVSKFFSGFFFLLSFGRKKILFLARPPRRYGADSVARATGPCTNFFFQNLLSRTGLSCRLGCQNAGLTVEAALTAPPRKKKQRSVSSPIRLSIQITQRAGVPNGCFCVPRCAPHHKYTSRPRASAASRNACLPWDLGTGPRHGTESYV